MAVMNLGLLTQGFLLRLAPSFAKTRSPILPPQISFALIRPGPAISCPTYTTTSLHIEVAFHKAEELWEINWQEKETFVYANFLADFRGEFHDIRGDSGFAKCLDPSSYITSQKLAGELLDKGSAGVVYPSVRHSGGTHIACFRPALVNNDRKGAQVSVEFENALPAPVIHPIPQNLEQSELGLRLGTIPALANRDPLHHVLQFNLLHP